MSSNLPSNPTASAQQLTVSPSSLKAAADTIMADIERPLEMARKLPVQTLQALIQTASQPLALSSTDHALQSVKMLMGQYRNGQFQDADVFAMALTALFAEHPAKYVQEIALELPREMKWPPSIAEVTEALKAKAIRRKAIEYRAKRMIEQQADKQKQEAASQATIAGKGTPEERAALVERLTAGFKANKMENA